MSWNVFRKKIAYLFVPVVIVLNKGEVSVSGMMIVAAGMLLRLWASGYLIKKTQLVSAGPYCFTRNPLYLGSFLIAFGFCAMVKNMWLAAVLILFFAIIYYKQIAHEENELGRLFGEKYAAYKKNVPRLFPRITPFRAGAEGKFDFKNIMRNKEYNMIIGVAAVFLLMHVYKIAIYPKIIGHGIY